MSKLVPQNPSAVTVIRAVTPNITTVSAPFNRFGMIKVGGRGTIVKLSNGSLAVFSPTALTPEVRTALQGLGNDVRYIAAPDIEHHIFLGEWAKAFPSASVIGMEGLPEKREKNPEQKGNPVFAHVFTAKNKAELKIDEAFDRDFDYEFVHSHQNKELVFNYKPERTLIQADLVWNLPATEQYSKSPEDANAGVATKIFVGLMNLKGNMNGQKRFLWHIPTSADRKGFEESVKRIDKWDFDRIIPCHGDVIETGGKAKFEKLMEWYLKGK